MFLLSTGLNLLGSMFKGKFKWHNSSNPTLKNDQPDLKMTINYVKYVSADRRMYFSALSHFNCNEPISHKLNGLLPLFDQTYNKHINKPNGIRK